MEYCRSIKFEEGPNYKTALSFLEKCVARNNFDMKITDFTWKQNRLLRDKEMLKNSVKNVLKKDQGKEDVLA
jgi:hypothetical protein